MRLRHKKIIWKGYIVKFLTAQIKNFGSYRTLDFSFKSIPTSNADLTVNDVAYTNKEIAVRTILSGNIVYNSIASAGTFVLVRVSNGKYTLIANDLKFVNASNAKDTVLVSTHIVEQ